MKIEYASQRGCVQHGILIMNQPLLQTFRDNFNLVYVPLLPDSVCYLFHKDKILYICRFQTKIYLY